MQIMVGREGSISAIFQGFLLKCLTKIYFEDATPVCHATSKCPEKIQKT